MWKWSKEHAPHVDHRRGISHAPLIPSHSWCYETYALFDVLIPLTVYYAPFLGKALHTGNTHRYISFQEPNHQHPNDSMWSNRCGQTESSNMCWNFAEALSPNKLKPCWNYPLPDLSVVQRPWESSTDTLRTTCVSSSVVPGTGSLTVLKRTSSPRRTGSTSRTPSQASIESDVASVDLTTEKLPPIDTPEASHVCSVR